MKLKMELPNLDDLDEAFHVLYTKKGDVFVLTGVEGLRTGDDVGRLQTSLTKERADHKATKDKFAAFVPFLEDVEETIAKLDKYDELSAAASGKLDETKITEIVESRVRSRVAPLERTAKQRDVELAALKAENGSLKDDNKRRTIRDVVVKSARTQKMVESAVDDAVMLAERLFETVEGGSEPVTRDGVGVTPGLSVDVWLTEMQSKRPHWWPASSGSGAGGSGGSPGVSNPWTADNWNLTQQGQIYTANPAKAEQMAKAAGVEVGSSAPRKK